MVSGDPYLDPHGHIWKPNSKVSRAGVGFRGVHLLCHQQRAP